MNNEFIGIAKNLRKRSTDAERVLWEHLRARQLEGLKFRRQEPMGYYVLDFVCYEKGIVIEVDGGQHTMEKEKNKERDNWLKRQGFKVLSFWNNEVLMNCSLANFRLKSGKMPRLFSTVYKIAEASCLGQIRF